MRNLLIVLAIVIFVAGCKVQKKLIAPIESFRGVKVNVAAAPIAANPMINSRVQHLQQGDIDAIKSFSGANTREPERCQGCLIIGQTYMHLKEYNRAIDTFMVATRVPRKTAKPITCLATRLG